MQYCSDKDMNQLVKRMVRTGWIFEHGKHGKLRHPAGIGFVTFLRTPSAPVLAELSARYTSPRSVVTRREWRSAPRRTSQRHRLPVRRLSATSRR